MLIPGIKIGPHQWQDRIAHSPRCVEIWYRVDWESKYIPIFTALQQQNIPFGLHFWGVTMTGHEANLAYPGEIQTQSIHLIESCLKTAHAWQAMYVNIHAGNTHPMYLNLDSQPLFTADPQLPTIPDAQAVTLRNQALEDLGRQAHTLNTTLLVELIPEATYNYDDRLRPVEQYPASPAGLIDLCKRRLIGFTNDFCHTFGTMSHQPRNIILKNFLDITRLFLPYTKLCHINTLYEPYNGTDAHGGILPSDFTKPGVFPNQNEYQQLFHLLQQQSHDVWLVGEPSTDHVENYQELVRLISQL